MNLFNLLTTLFLAGTSPQGKAPQEVVNIKSPTKAKIEALSLGFKLNDYSEVNGLFSGKLKKDNSKINYSVLGNLGENNQELGAKFGIEYDKFDCSAAANFGSENFNFNKVSAKTEGNTSESSIYDQTTNTDRQKIGIGIGGTTFSIEYADIINNTEDKSTEDLTYEETYGNGNSITVINKTDTDIKVKRKDKVARFEAGLLSKKEVNVAFDLYANWQSMSTDGSTITSSQIINNGDTTTNYNVVPQHHQTDRTIWTLKPKIEAGKRNVYGYGELPVHLGGDCNAVELNGGIAGYSKKWVSSATLNSNFNEKEANLELNLVRSNRPHRAFGKLEKRIKGYWRRASSLLHSDEERAIKDKIAYDNFTRNIQGFGGGFEIKMKEGEKPGYGLSLVGSKNNHSGYVSASTQNPSDIKRNYEFSVTYGGCTNGCSTGFSCGVSYSKVDGKPGCGLNITIGK